MANKLVRELCTSVHYRRADNDGKADEETEHWAEFMGNSYVGFTTWYRCF